MKRLIKRLCGLLPTKKLIVLESIPNLSDNTKAVFDEMINRQMNEKYKFVWVITGPDDNLPRLKNVKYCDKSRPFYRYRLAYYHNFARAIICCNEFFATIRRGQTSFYLTHGTSVKSIRDYYNVPQGIDYTLLDGEGVREMMAYQLNTDYEKTVALGYPRNDVLVRPPRDIHYLFPGSSGEKIVVWYPTFRQHKNGEQNATAHALPILHDEAQAELLDKIARRNNVLIVLKPHFAQDVSKINAREYSNIKFIDDAFLERNNITSYEFVAACDALLSDYSSVYFDFLLCDKPIGLIWEDYEEYKTKIDFAIDMDYYMKAGEKIYNLGDLEGFLERLAAGKDDLKAQRAEISAWANYSHDGQSAKRVTDFIIEKAKL